MKPCARVTKLKNGCDEMTRSAKRSSQLSYPVPVATGTGLEPATSPLSVDETLSARNQDCRKKTAMQRSRRVIFRRPTIRRLAGVEPDLRIGLMKPCPRAVRFFRSPPRSHRYVRQFWWLGPGRGAVRWWTCRYRNRVQLTKSYVSFTRVVSLYNAQDRDKANSLCRTIKRLSFGFFNQRTPTLDNISADDLHIPRGLIIEGLTYCCYAA